MSTSRSDAVAERPAAEQELSNFRGFSAVDGVIQTENDPKPAAQGAGEGQQEQQSDGERAEDVRAAAKGRTAAEKLAALSPGSSAPIAEDDESGDSDADDGQDGTGEGQQEQQPAEQRRNAAQERINKAVGRQRAAERERDAANRRADALEARIRALESSLSPQNGRATPHAAQGQLQPPSPQDYQYGEMDPRYIRELARFETLQTLQSEQDRQAQASREDQNARQRQAAEQKFREFEAEGLARYPDFAEVVIESAKRLDWNLSPHLAALLVDSEHGTDIAYHLAQHPKEAREVYQMSPAKQAAWFGRREAVLSSQAPDAGDYAPRVSRAPETPSRVARGTGTKPQARADTTDFAAFERLASAKT